jgi:hypothetical protein
MAASKKNPIYTVYLIAGNKKYNLTPVCTDISPSHPKNQIAQSVTLHVVNIRLNKKETLCQIIAVRQRVMVYANDGEKKAEVFRGWIWTRYHESEVEGSIITLKCYDNLIYMQESEDSLYFSKGSKTNSVMSNICSKWGIKLKYTYSSITHDKLVLRGTLSNIITSDILDLVKKKTGEKYVIKSIQDVMYITPEGTNQTVYKIEKKKNAVRVRYEQTMDEMVTKVVILGKAEKNSKKRPVVATVTGNTSKYGTLQKLEDKDEDTSLAEAKKEAQTIINEKGKPETEFEIEASDIPWIMKGDLVYVDAGHLTQEKMIVLGIERDISNNKKTMVLTCKIAS